MIKINRRTFLDKAVYKFMLTFILFILILTFLIIIGLYIRSRPILKSKSIFELLFSSSWHPLKGEFGFKIFIVSTICVTALSLIIAVPFSLLTALYLSEYANKKIRNWIKPFIDLLSGIPSVIYGIWGVLLIIPLIKKYVAPIFGVYTSGYSLLAGGIVLAIMISPFIVHISLEVLSSVPYELRESSLSLGATKWQTTKYVVMRKAFPGIMASVVLALSRAFGETMAVLMVAGNVVKIPKSVFDPAYPLPALIANNYGEMLSIPLYDSALLLASLILLVVVLVFNIFSRIILIKIEKRAR